MSPATVRSLIESTLTQRGIDWERHPRGGVTALLPGTHRLTTRCTLTVGDHAVRVEAFVMRRPDENHERLWAWLLRRNAGMYGVAFAIDGVGDVYLVGRIALHAITPDEIDRILGSVLTYADESFNSMLEIGFESAIRREWAWRVSRGESVANLEAFAHLADSARTTTGAGAEDDTSTGSPA